MHRPGLQRLRALAQGQQGFAQLDQPLGVPLPRLVLQVQPQQADRAAVVLALAVGDGGLPHLLGIKPRGQLAAGQLRVVAAGQPQLQAALAAERFRPIAAADRPP